MNLTLKKVIILFTIAISLSFSLAFAQETYKLSVPIPVPGKAGPVEELKITDPGQAVRAYVTTIFRFGLGIGALLAVGAIVFGGIKRIVSRGNPSEINEANDIILNAVWGLALLMGATLILFVINPKLTLLQLPALKQVQLQPTEEALALRQELQRRSQEYNAAQQDLQQTVQNAPKNLDGDIAIAEKQVAASEINLQRTFVQFEVARNNYVFAYDHVWADGDLGDDDKVYLGKAETLLAKARNDVEAAKQQLDSDRRRLEDLQRQK